MVVAYYMALTVTKPVAAIGNFFITVIMVILATYLLFNAGFDYTVQFLKSAKATIIKRRFHFCFQSHLADA